MLSNLPLAVAYIFLILLMLVIYQALAASTSSWIKKIMISLVGGILLTIQINIQPSTYSLLLVVIKYLVLIMIFLFNDRKNIFQAISYGTTIFFLFFISYVSLEYLCSFTAQSLILNNPFYEIVALFSAIILYLIMVETKLVKFNHGQTIYDFYLTIVNCLAMLIVPSFFTLNPNLELWPLSNYLILLACYIIVILCIYGLNQLIELTKKSVLKKYLLQYNNTLKLFSNQVTQEKQAAIKIRHDTKKHFIILKELLAANYIDQAISYIDKIKLVNSHQLHSYSNNIILDAYLNNIIASNPTIDFIIKAQGFDQLSDNNLDYLIIITNLIENAVENISTPKQIQATFKYEQEQIIIKVSNSTLTNPLDNNFKSNKGADHGLGMMIITDLLQQYNGEILYSYTDYTFSIYITLELNRRKYA